MNMTAAADAAVPSGAVYAAQAVRYYLGFVWILVGFASWTHVHQQRAKRESMGPSRASILFTFP